LNWTAATKGQPRKSWTGSRCSNRSKTCTIRSRGGRLSAAARAA
jgi:hypothetical protein